MLDSGPPAPTAMQSVTSRQNPLVQSFRALATAPDPDGVRLLLDGVHLVRAALDAGLALEAVAVAASRLDAASEEGETAHALDRSGVPVTAVPDRVFPAVSPVRSPTGIVAIALRAPSTPAAVCAVRGAFVLGLVDVQDPGNLGAVLRVAEAAGITGALVGGASASPASWKAARGSMGAVLRLPVASGLGPGAMVAAMRDHGLRTVAAVPRGGADPDGIDWTGGVGLVLGGEGRGLDAATAAACDARVTIPMAPPVESLNVATAGAVLVYAARRQRA